MDLTVSQINERVEKEFPLITQVIEEVSKIIVGQRNVIDKLLVGLLGQGHVLVEGVPGLAKTTAINALSSAISADFSRIQFTPDLLPADLIGTQIYSQTDGDFKVRKGPMFANIVLADEINRAPAKVQSALLEAMGEKQVTIGNTTYKLPEPFMVMATQNPVEQEGTYPLPEAQIDRFMLKVLIDYPTKDEEIKIMKRIANGEFCKINPVITPEKIIEIRKLIENIFVDEKLYGYIADLVFATRNPAAYGLKELSSMIELGGSPRASINLIRASKVMAFLNGRGFVTPSDIKAIGPDVLRHRITLTYEAEAQDLNSDDILIKIFDNIDVP